MKQSIAFMLTCAIWSTTAAQGTASPTPSPRADLPTIKVGDSWRWIRSDRRTGQQEADTLRTVKSVSATTIEGEENGGGYVQSTTLAVLETPEFKRSGDARFLDFPLEVGKKWSFAYTQAGKTRPYEMRWQYETEIVAYEKVKVPAGEFDAFKIVSKGFGNSLRGNYSGSATSTSWYAPAARGVVKIEYDEGRNSTTTVLTELQLQP
jgi:hypothetical protein